MRNLPLQEWYTDDGLERTSRRKDLNIAEAHWFTLAEFRLIVIGETYL
jgi:hypothetical protein